MSEYSRGVAAVLRAARAEARVGSAPDIEPGHLLMGVTMLCGRDVDRLLDGRGDATHAAVASDAPRIQRCFDRVEVDPTLLRRRLRVLLRHARPTLRPGAAPHRNPPALRAFRRAAELAAPERVRAIDLMQAVLEEPSDACSRAFADLGVEDPLGTFFPDAAPRAARATPLLDRFGRDLSRLAREGRLPPLIGRRDELRTLARVLVKQRKPNAVLVGHPGVGKTGIVEGLAARLAVRAPQGLVDARIVEVSMPALLAGAGVRGAFEERLLGVIDEARKDPRVIVFVDELHTVIGAGGRGAGDAADILKPALARGELRCIGATTPAEFRRHVEADGALARRFEAVWVDEPSRAEAVTILAGLCDRFADHHGVGIDDDVPRVAVDLAVRYLPGLWLPDKAIDLVDHACAAARISTLGTDAPAGPAGAVGAAELAAVIADRVGVPVGEVAVDEAQRLLGMEAALRARVLGQDGAVHSVAEAVRTARVGLGDPHRPIGSFLLAGPTGTGKTELARALAEFLFHDEQRLIRIDMSEYQERHAVSRLLGAPPGYLGHDQDGQLSGPLRDHPHSVVLFDEIEKAHPQVLDVLLQILDAGRLTDARGRRVTFADTVVVLTTNLGTGREALGHGADRHRGAHAAIMGALRDTLRPELLGRIDRVVVFDPLTGPVLRQILQNLVARVAGRLADKDVGLVVSDRAAELLLRQVDGDAGARSLVHAVDRLLVAPLGRLLLEATVAAGSSIHVDADDHGLTFTPAAATKGRQA